MSLFMSLLLLLSFLFIVIYIIFKGYNFYVQRTLKMDPKLFEILQNYSRIRLIGCAASGKSTLANTLFAKIQSLKSEFLYISLDDIKHKPNSGFQLIRGEKYRKALVKELEIANKDFNDKWIMDGNAIANKTLKIKVWNNTQVVIVFNYSFITVFIRGIIRSIRRVLFREKCCNGNQETFDQIVNGKTKYSVPKLIWYSHSNWPQKIEKIKKEILNINSDILWITFDDPNQCQVWLKNTIKNMQSEKSV